LSSDQPPPFRMFGSTGGILTETEMDGLVADHRELVKEGALGAGMQDSEIRRSQVAFLEASEKYRWLYERIWETAGEFNRRYIGVDVAGIEGNIQVTRYDSSDQGFYTWHTDFARTAPNRKISITVQLSRPVDYEGGDLELFFDREPLVAERARGALIAFPSFVLHRVTPVTRGTRWSLVAWVSGPRWR
jgi:predicted 2-oxoglutarate/Fe(II)-dependent dioxygenase YbiX